MHEAARHSLVVLIALTPDRTGITELAAIHKMKTAIIAALALGASAFAPAPAQTRSTALNAQKPVS